MNPFRRERFPTPVVKIGSIKIGGDGPIVVQSMTTVDTLDTQGSIEESIRMIEAGCELVRLTAPSKKEAENLRNIRDGLQKLGYVTPLVADIHFTPNAAEVAAQIVEKVRVNPGNYADKKRFEELEYTDETYRDELKRIEEKFTPLILLCKENGTAMRIGTNHGSLSDRILSRFGDTPKGMVESAMEFIRICRKNNYHTLVISMKASNTLVMVQAYRLLMATMRDEGFSYPIHLGVTEAGDGEDGRIKSAVGIGALLEDGIGDTIRVSLTEDPEVEIPVARKLLSKFAKKEGESPNLADEDLHRELPFHPYEYKRRASHSILTVGGHQHPVVFGDLSKHVILKPSHLYPFGYNYSATLDKWNITDHAADFIYIGSNTIDFQIPGTLGLIQDLECWQMAPTKEQHYPLLKVKDLDKISSDQVAFVLINPLDKDLAWLSDYYNVILIPELDSNLESTQKIRFFYLNLTKFGVTNPVVLSFEDINADAETFVLHQACRSGIHFIDGFGDGLWLKGQQSSQQINSTTFGILQATRTRISKTEYISCPSCGRTLFNLQETTAKIRARTSHLKGIKIGIMGCIVNGPGEMADADYGYVGTGPGKITLYKEKEVIQKNVPEEEAVDALIALIAKYGDWVDPKMEN